VVPKVFISSTVEDLKEYRQAAKDAALRVGFLPVMFEHWPASGNRLPLEACMQAVAECDLLIAIVAHRYGWVPEGNDKLGTRSITWLECEKAIESGKEVLALVLDDETPWAAELREEYAAVTALQRGIPTPEDLLAIRRGIDQLKEFKIWLRSRGVRATFRNAEDLRGELIAALNDWRGRHHAGGASEVRDAADFTRYLRHIREICGFIDIRGLQVGSGKVNKFSIEDLYIRVDLKSEGSKSHTPGEAAERQLELLLEQRRAVIIGDPGSGKTTLLRRVAHSLAIAWLRVRADAAKIDFGIEGEPPLPLLIRLSDLSTFLERSTASNASELPSAADSPEWLPLFMSKMSREYHWGLDAAVFRELLTQGRAIVLLDGLDEAPLARVRKVLTVLIENCARVYDQCAFLLTSRPKGYTPETSLREFQVFEVQPLSEGSVQAFLHRWCESLFREEPVRREQHFSELCSALDSSAEIRRMAANPVMLTALAVVHWNQKRIPEQRAELYESILTWLCRAREDRKGRTSPEKCMRLLQSVALTMQNSTDGRLVEASRRWAAEEIAARSWEGEMGVDRAEQFLMEEELDSGIVVARGDNVRFWHLSFQEYLAARAIAALGEQDQKSLLISDARKVLAPEWRETVLLFAGILHHQGPEKLNSMLGALLDLPGMTSSMSNEAGLISLVGAIQRDLTAFGFILRDERFDSIRERIMRIFDPKRQLSIPPQERLEAAEALGQSGDPRLDGERWVYTPAGSFLIGAQRENSDAPGYDPCALANELRCRTIELNEIHVSRFPVTVADFGRFIADSGYDNPEYWKAGGFGEWKRPDQWDSQIQFSNRPVVGLSWFEAQAWCRWAGWGVKLLTEEEWECTARGKSGRLFPWGDTQPDGLFLNYANGDSIGRPTPVGFYPLGNTPEGIADLAGNVFEWCEDEVERGRRALRGGCFRSVDIFVRCSARGSLPANARTDFIGFRVCRTYGPSNTQLTGPRSKATPFQN
jgi:formylglycine-generating enzyme required for sulfatase activity